jgi:GTP 3',8-cyclase
VAGRSGKPDPPPGIGKESTIADHPIDTAALVDLFGRRFKYLRLSVTDVCNFRCEYCLPDGYQGGRRDFLGRAEILRLVRAFAELGIVKLRLTGGEPLVRRDIVDIVGDVAGVPGHRALGHDDERLPPGAHRRRAARRRAPRGQHQPRQPRSRDVRAHHRQRRFGGHGRRRRRGGGGPRVKVNAILLGGQNDAEIPDFIEFVRDRPVSVRFIELMQTGGNGATSPAPPARHALVTDRLRAEGWTPLTRGDTAGPAQRVRSPRLRRPHRRDRALRAHFCDGCNRLRVTALGGLRLCLFGTGTHDLRPAAAARRAIATR